MSYSFSVKAPDKAAAKAAVEKEFERVVSFQPIHERDRAAAMANANAVIDLLVDDPNCHVSVSLSGYVSWRGTLKEGVPDESNTLSSASVAASAALVAPG